MHHRLAARWLLVALAALAVGLVSCGPPNKPPPAVDEGVTIRLIVDGPGRIGSLPTFTCPDDCEWTLPADESVAIYGLPSTGNVFVAWDGACADDTLNFACTRVFEDGDTVTAKFAQHALRLDLTGDGEGAFTITGGGITTTCDADCGLALPALSYAIQYVSRGTTGTTLGAWGGACEDAALPGYCLVQVTGSTDVSKRWVHPPVAVDDPDYAINAGTTLFVPAAQGVLANDEDTEGDPLTAQLVGGTGNGSLSLSANGGFSYTPDADFAGEDTFTYRARDAFGNLSNTATVTITVTQVNRAPVANDITYDVDWETTLTVPAPGVLTNDTDPDGDALSAVPGTPASNGTLELNPDGSFTYTPNPGFSGPDSFTYTASDGELTSAPATVTITVTQVNRPPVANDDAYDVDYETELVVLAPGVLSNDTDPDGDALTATVDTAPSNGTLELNPDGSFTYTPDDGFSGEDTFTYTASDGEFQSAPATVTLTVAEEEE